MHEFDIKQKDSVLSQTSCRRCDPIPFPTFFPRKNPENRANFVDMDTIFIML